MGISEDQMKFEPLSDDFDQNNNEPLENGFGKKIMSLCNYRMKMLTIFSWYSCGLIFKYFILDIGNLASVYTN